jgi:hypothetical protein
MSLSLFIISHHQLNGFCHYGLENPLGVIFLVRAAMLSLLVNLQKSQGEFTVAFFCLYKSLSGKRTLSKSAILSNHAIE